MRKTNLMQQSGNGVLESLGDVDQATNIMTYVGIHDTLGTHGSLVSFAVRDNFLVRMHLAMKNSGGG